MRTLEEFKEIFYQKYPNSDIEILEFSDRIGAKNEKYYVFVKDKYSTYESIKGNLLKRGIVSIECSINKIEYLTNKIKEKFPENLKEYTITDYKNKDDVIVKTKYGLCKCRSNNLLKGFPPSITCAINKEEYLTNMISEYHPDKIKNYTIIKYQDQDNVLTKDNFGLCKSNSYHLLNGGLPNIMTALNKTEYFLNKVKEDYKSLYDFKDYEYIKNTIKSKLICSKHGEFFINPGDILNGTGCSKCGDERCSLKHSENPTGWGKENWYKAAANSKGFESFKVYVLRCWKDEEEFYKIGRTFLKIKKRFLKGKMPYNYEIIKIIEFKELTKENCSLCYNLETELKRENKSEKYIPKIFFEGMQECFNKVNI